MIRPILNAEETVKGTKVLLNQKPYFLYLEENGKRCKNRNSCWLLVRVRSY